MERSVDSELRQLKEKILTMGGYVEKALDDSLKALIQRKPELFDNVYEVEKEVNQKHIEVDEACLRILARQAPMAADLRLVVAVIKINTDLERMGDQAVNISHNAKRYITEPPLKPLIDLPRMAEEVRAMVRFSLDAFVRGDVALAEKVLAMDDLVDGLKNQIYRELITYIVGDPKVTERALNLILIARNLERLGDHATNIAEDVIFAISGKDIRHGGGAGAQAGSTQK
ncbi:MAG: phosphate signaling complex protein PhoU [Bdellovibrionales bacterium]|nr:phosphate signaling complex protein PhoU [Bdellovibrionales bacterium]